MKLERIESLHPPKGGRIHTVRVLVDAAREWNAAIDAAGPETGWHFSVREVGEFYPPQVGSPKYEEIVLVNFGTTIHSVQFAVTWGTQYGLKPKLPRSVFAIGEHKSKLHQELNVEEMAIISPVSCRFKRDLRVCRIWLLDTGCDVCLAWSDNNFTRNCWFAFSFA